MITGKFFKIIMCDKFVKNGLPLFEECVSFDVSQENAISFQDSSRRLDILRASMFSLNAGNWS
jgi:hypothetical protein